MMAEWENKSQVDLTILDVWGVGSSHNRATNGVNNLYECSDLVGKIVHQLGAWLELNGEP